MGSWQFDYILVKAKKNNNIKLLEQILECTGLKNDGDIDYMLMDGTYVEGPSFDVYNCMNDYNIYVCNNISNIDAKEYYGFLNSILDGISVYTVDAMGTTVSDYYYANEVSVDAQEKQIVRRIIDICYSDDEYPNKRKHNKNKYDISNKTISQRIGKFDCDKVKKNAENKGYDELYEKISDIIKTVGKKKKKKKDSNEQDEQFGLENDEVAKNNAETGLLVKKVGSKGKTIEIFNDITIKLPSGYYYAQEGDGGLQVVRTINKLEKVSDDIYKYRDEDATDGFMTWTVANESCIDDSEFNFKDYLENGSSAVNLLVEALGLGEDLLDSTNYPAYKIIKDKTNFKVGYTVSGLFGTIMISGVVLTKKGTYSPSFLSFASEDFKKNEKFVLELLESVELIQDSKNNVEEKAESNDDEIIKELENKLDEDVIYALKLEAETANTIFSDPLGLIRKKLLVSESQSCASSCKIYILAKESISKYSV